MKGPGGVIWEDYGMTEYHTVTDLGQDGVLCLCSLNRPHTEEEAYASGAWEDDRDEPAAG